MMEAATQARPQWITVKEAAGMLSVSYKRCYELIDTGHLPAYRIGTRSIRLRVDEVEAFLDENCRV